MQLNTKIFLRPLLPFLSLILLLNSTPALPQADSLTQVVLTAPSDSVKAMTALKLAFHYTFREPDSARRYLDLATKIAFTRKIPYAELTAYNIRGVFHDVLGQSDSAYFYFKLGLERNEIYGYPDMDVRLLNNLGLYCWNKGRLMEAQEHFHQSIEKNKLVPEGKKKLNSSVMLANIGLIYQQQNLFEKGLEYHLQAYEIRKKDNLQSEMPSSLNNMGICYRHLDSLNRSQEVFLQAMEMAEAQNNLHLLADIRTNLALVYAMQNRHSESLALNLAALPFMEGSDQSKRKLMNLHAEIGGNYIHLKWIEKAESHINRALEILSENPDFEHSALSTYGFASTLSYLQGEPQKGLEYLLRRQKIEENNYSDKFAKQLSEMETQYQVRLKEDEISLLNAQTQNSRLVIQKQRLTLLAGSLAVLVISILAFFLFHRYRRDQAIKKAQELHKFKEAERIRIARDMHDDMGAGLTRIVMRSELAKRQLQSVAKQETSRVNEKEVVGILEKMGDESRLLSHSLGEIIWALNPQNDTLDALCAYLRNYSSDYLEDAGINSSINFPEEIPPIPLTADLRRNIFLVLKESLNNIVKHSRATEVQITLKIEEGMLDLLIRDNGIGLQNEKDGTTGNGLTNMRKRSREAGGEFVIQNEAGSGLLIGVKGIPIE